MKRPPLPDLPVAEALPRLVAALDARGVAVLEAPPGAGKTTLVPIALMDRPWARGRILMLEPRRVAARAAAERIAALLGEKPGGAIGYRHRGASVPGKRVEILTDGILTRMLQEDPNLPGVACVIFDEIHERALQADLGLALTLEARAALRPDLRVLAMSATLEAGRLAEVLGGEAGPAPVVRAQGRMFPVQTRWLDRPWRRPGGRGPRFEDAMADLIARAMAEEGGSALAFLPGAGEIGRVAARLAGRLPQDADIAPIHGALPFARQRAALAPAAPGRRKLVLATAIAETSLTVEGVRVVIDGGLARRARFDPASGMARLVTEKATRAEAEQRRGRAGRLAPGACYRLWTKGEEGGLAPHPPPEILSADLAALALDLAVWGARPEELPFLDRPPEAAMAAARRLLGELGALDRAGRPTALGRRMAALPAHPRLARMLLRAREAGAEAALAADLAALLEERDFSGPGAPADLGPRLAVLRGAGEADVDRARLAAIRDAARRLRRAAGAAGAADAAGRRGGNGPGRDFSAVGRLVALAWPDRVAMRRPGSQSGGAARYLLSGGKGAALSPEDSLAAQPFLAVADTDGNAREARIRRAAPLAHSDIEALFADRIETVELCAWSPRMRAVVARRRRMFGALVLDDRPWPDAPPERLAAAMTEGVRALGLEALPWTDEARRLRARVLFARAGRADLPDWSDAALLARLEDWLTPHLAGCRAADDLARLDLAKILLGALDGRARKALDAAAPPFWTAPTGTRCPIDYGRDPPAIAVRVQELFGLDAHPRAGASPLLLDLLSPARRPVQTTADLPGFWRSSWADVRREMRGRYPRHPWPEKPWLAAPTARAKRRGS